MRLVDELARAAELPRVFTLAVENLCDDERGYKTDHRGDRLCHRAEKPVPIHSRAGRSGRDALALTRRVQIHALALAHIQRSHHLVVSRSRNNSGPKIAPVESMMSR